MENLFAILLLLSHVGLLITLVKPSFGLFWLKAPSRKKGFLIYSFTNILFFVCFGVSIRFPFRIAPYYINSDSIKHAFSHSVPAFTFSKYDTISANIVLALGSSNPDSQEWADHIAIEYNPKNRVVNNVDLEISLTDTVITASDIDRLIAFANYFDIGSSDHFRRLKPTLLQDLFWHESGAYSYDKNLGFSISSYPYTLAKKKISQGEKFDRRDLNISMSVGHSNPYGCSASKNAFEEWATEHPLIANTYINLVLWILKLWSFTDYYPYGAQIVEYPSSDFDLPIYSF